MHDAGVVYLDISPKNVLYSASDNKFCLIDIDKVELHDALDERQRIDHITVFRSRFPLTPSFYDGYGNQVARHTADIEKQAAAMERARVERVSRICLTHRHEVTTKRIGGLKWHIRIADLDENLERVLREPDSGTRLPMVLSSIASHFTPAKKLTAVPTARSFLANPGCVLSPQRTNAFSECSCADTLSRKCRSRNYSISQTMRKPRMSLISPGSSPSRRALDV